VLRCPVGALPNLDACLADLPEVRIAYRTVSERVLRVTETDITPRELEERKEARLRARGQEPIAEGV
jgi:hypothetical protein